ncbi:hypothetical protein PENSPDRAFT_733693 [Peniophora sp. CONT]|nr:hypothetical protein PENSPDRAFT_733693 [Peniophora sp. CONT]
MPPKHESKYPPSFTLTVPVLYDSAETYRVGDDIRTEELTIARTLNNAMLYQRLASYNIQLEKRAVREKMLDTLVLYAHDRSVWDSQFKPAGADGGTGKTRKLRDDSKLNQIVEEVFGKKPTTSDDATFKSTSNTIIDRRRPADIEQMRDLARRSLETRATRAASAKGLSDVEGAKRKREQQREDEVDHLRQMVGQLTAQLQALVVLSSQVPNHSQHAMQPFPGSLHSSEGTGNVADVMAVGSTPATPSAAPALRFATISPTPLGYLPSSELEDTASSTAISSCVSPDPSPPPPPRFLRLTLESGGEIQLSVNELTVPIAAPSLSFSSPERYKLLFQQWDSTDVNVNDAFLVLPTRKPGAQVIPVSVWNQLFQKKTRLAADDAWNDMKSSWHNWKYLVEEYHRLGSSYERFNAQYTVDGVLQSYTTILSRLRAERGRQQAQDVRDAKAFFGNDLFCDRAGDTFRYKKTNAMCNMKESGRISQAWRKLLATDETVRREWHERQHMPASSPSSLT